MKRFIYICKKCGFEYGGPDGTPLSCSYCGTVNDLAYVEGDIITRKIMKIKKNVCVVVVNLVLIHGLLRIFVTDVILWFWKKFLIKIMII